MEGNRAGRAWSLAMMVAVASLSGCVMNPYIRSSSVPVKPNSSTLCNGWNDSAVGEADALKYATCLRRVMEDKASRHAMMNNGGGPLLLGIAGLAAYRGFQGGHEANIAALTMGGAALYGAQQYLYRAPRESIYLAGAGALACAIHQTQRKLLVEDKLDSAEVSATSGLRAADQAIYRLGSPADRGRPPVQCLVARGSFDEARGNELAARKMRDELDGRLKFSKARLAQLRATTGDARIDLIAATDAIVTTVNQQLVQQQPDPADLAALLARLKSPATPPPAKDEAPPGKVDLTKFGDFTKNLDLQGLLGEVGEGAVDCGKLEERADSYAAEVSALMQAVDAAAKAEDKLEGWLDMQEKRLGASAAKDDSMQLCYRPPSMSLLPFSLVFAQPGAQSLGKDPLLIPISGGAPPFSVVATEGTTQLTGKAEADDAGGYRLKLERGTNPAVGLHTVIATDNAGTARIFQVDIQK